MDGKRATSRAPSFYLTYGTLNSMSLSYGLNGCEPAVKSDILCRLQLPVECVRTCYWCRMLFHFMSGTIHWAFAGFFFFQWVGSRDINSGSLEGCVRWAEIWCSCRMRLQCDYSWTVSAVPSTFIYGFFFLTANRRCVLADALVTVDFRPFVFACFDILPCDIIIWFK